MTHHHGNGIPPAERLHVARLEMSALDGGMYSEEGGSCAGVW